jgi:hypothetical protein
MNELRDTLAILQINGVSAADAACLSSGSAARTPVHPCFGRLANADDGGAVCVDAGGAELCCMAVSLPNRKSVGQTSLSGAHVEMEPSRDCVLAGRAERPGRPRRCRQVWVTWERWLVHACA